MKKKTAKKQRIQIEQEVLDELDLSYDEQVGACCALGAVVGVDSDNSVEELLAARYGAWDDNLYRAVLVTTIPQEGRGLPRRLREAGFTQIAKFPRTSGSGLVTLWIAKTLSDKEVDIVDDDDEEDDW